jgi:hypothetical protein
MSTIKLESGDANDPMNYTLTCKCSAFLGPLGRFRENKDGWRSILCPKCEMVTLIKGTEVKMVSELQVPRNE